MPCERRGRAGRERAGRLPPARAAAAALRASEKGAALGARGPQPRRSVRPEHLLEGLACIEHAVLAGVPLDGRVLAGRKAHWH